MSCCWFACCCPSTVSCPGIPAAATAVGSCGDATAAAVVYGWSGAEARGICCSAPRPPSLPDPSTPANDACRWEPNLQASVRSLPGWSQQAAGGLFDTRQPTLEFSSTPAGRSAMQRMQAHMAFESTPCRGRSWCHCCLRTKWHVW
jgi:hypothetical protein